MYKYLQIATLGTKVTLPTGWKEIIVITHNTNGTPNLNFSIPKAYATDESSEQSVSSGYYTNSAYYGFARIAVQSTYIRLAEYTHCGSNPTNASIHIYYR